MLGELGCWFSIQQPGIEVGKQNTGNPLFKGPQSKQQGLVVNCVSKPANIRATKVENKLPKTHSIMVLKTKLFLSPNCASAMKEVVGPAKSKSG